MSKQAYPGSPEAQSWPRLSQTLPGPRHPERCQRCGVEDGESDLTRWREHDAWDKPQDITLNLCEPCADAVIEKHPRLYDRVPRNAPVPGNMDLCVDCQHRDGVRCTHPDLMANGGAGLVIRFAKPHVVFIDGTKGGRRCGWQETRYPGPVTECVGRQIVTQSEALAQSEVTP